MIMISGALISGDLPPGPTPLVTGAGQRVTITAFPHQAGFILRKLVSAQIHSYFAQSHHINLGKTSS